MEFKTKYLCILTLIILSLISSLILSLENSSEVCKIGEIDIGGCNNVQNSYYNEFLGIKNSYYGIIIFTILSLFIYSHIKNPTKNKRFYIHLSIIIGSIISLYFIYLQAFIIKGYCQFCLVVDISLIIAMIIILFNWKK